MKTIKHLTVGLLLTFLLSANAQAQQTCKPTQIIESTPTSRFTIHGDGTVTDTQTGLMWAQCEQGLSGSDCARGYTTTHTWSAALALTSATSETANTYSDWRLPNIKELDSIVEVACHSPAINQSVFPNTNSSFFWSGSPDANSSDSAWGVGFSIGFVSDNNRSDDQRVRLVRGGQ